MSRGSIRVDELRQKRGIFFPGSNTLLADEGTLGYRIKKSMDVKFDSNDLDMLRQENAAIEVNLVLGNVMYTVLRVHVLCEPLSKYVIKETLSISPIEPGLTTVLTPAVVQRRLKWSVSSP